MHATRTALRHATTAAIALAFASSVLAQGGDSGSRSMISPTSETPLVTKAAAVDRSVVRQRPIIVDLAAMERQSVGNAPITLELFDRMVITLDPERAERRGPGNFTYFGKIRGSPKSEAVLTIVAGHLTAMITTQDAHGHSKAYRIQSQPGIGHWLQELNPDAFPVDHPPGQETLIAPPEGKSKAIEGPSKDDVETKADAGDTVDLLVVYSNQTATAAGSAIGSQIQAAVDAANRSFANSGITMRLRLVHYAPANYAESGDFNTDLSRLRGTTDGYMDLVHALRDSYAADLVSMFVENGAYCGMGYIGPSVSAAFTVVNRGCAAGNYTLAHEIGHNFGSRHDPYVDASTSPYAHGHGHANVAGKWRTVMAYNNVCSAAGTSCTRVGHWSNPNVLYSGAPTGTPENGTSPTSDNARVFNKNAYTVANFRVSGNTPMCTYSLSTSSASIGVDGGSGSTSVTSGSGCAWNATPSASWITVAAGSGTSGSGTLNFAVAANTGAARSGSISIGNQALMISQATGCSYTVTPISQTVGASGGTGTAAVSTTSAGCTWTASSGASWLTITSGASGTGNGTVSYSVASNGGSMRTGNLIAAANTVTVTQDAVGPYANATLSPTSISFGNVAVNSTSRAKTATFTNTGTVALTVSGVTPTGTNASDFTVAGCGFGAGSPSVPAGTSCTLSITFAPKAAGTRSATVEVKAANGTQTNVTSGSLTVTGTGKSRGGK